MKRKRVALMLQLFQSFDKSVLRGIIAYARAKGNWSVYVEEHLDFWIPHKMTGWDGFIVNFHNKEFAKAVQNVNIPLIAIAGSETCPYLPDAKRKIPLVKPDNAAMGRLAAEHLLECGLKNFSFCGYLPDPTATTDWSIERQLAFENYLTTKKIHPLPAFLQSQKQDAEPEKLQKMLIQWLKKMPKPVGVLACYDWHARHVLEACRTARLRVPDDVVLLGVDNNDLICDLSDPPLSSIEQGGLGIGETAATLLDQWMHGKKPKKLLHTIAPVGLVMRQSSHLFATDDDLCSMALRMIREEACAGLQAGQLAKKLGVSRSTLDNRLKAAAHRTADLEIRRVRINKAKELLARTSLSLPEIAKRTCLKTQQYLSSVIRVETGLSPMKYRKAHHPTLMK